MKKVIRAIKSICIFFLANVFAFFLYDKKYLKGIHFKSKYWGVFAPGWSWICTDAMARLLFGINKGVPFPVSPRVRILGHSNIIFHVDDINNFQGIGNYYQAFGTGKIIIGKGSWIASNVGLVTTNHDINDPDLHVESKNVVLGEKCWIGMNTVILPGVVLGPNTTVGAGSVVTKSFAEGYCVVAGNPAKVIKKLK